MLNPNDTTRVRRAFEIYEHTGMSIAEWFAKPMIKDLPEADFFVIRLLPLKAALDERCNLRFDKMIEAGVLEEIKALKAENLPKNLPAMRAQGVPEILAYLNNEMSLSEAVDLAKIHTRQYAKRQLTWFRNKLKADVTLEECYNGEKITLAQIVSML